VSAVAEGLFFPDGSLPRVPSGRRTPWATACCAWPKAQGAGRDLHRRHGRLRLHAGRAGRQDPVPVHAPRLCRACAQGCAKPRS